MAIITICPSCSSKMQAPDHAVGRKIRCPKCQTVVSLAEGEENRAPSTSRKSGSAPPTRKSGSSAPATKKPASRKETSSDDFDESAGPSPSRSGARRTQRDFEEDDIEEIEELEEVEDEEPARPRRGKESGGTRSTRLPPHLEEQVEEELTKGEQPVWVGQPCIKLVMMRGLWASLVGVILGGGGFGYSMVQFGGKESGGAGFLIAFVGFLVIGLMIAAPPLWQRFKAMRTIYLLTNKRVLVWEVAWYGGTNLRNYSARDAQKMRREAAWFVSKAGDLIFEEERKRVKSRLGLKVVKIKHGFLAIERVREIEKLVRETLC